MSYLIDTAIILEVIRPEPNAKVVEWIESTPDTALHLSVLSIGEITQSVAQLDDQERQSKIRLWLKHDLANWFGDRILPIDGVTATIWGNLANLNYPDLNAIDQLLAATAIKHDLNIVSDKKAFGQIDAIEAINPYEMLTTTNDADA